MKQQRKMVIIVFMSVFLFFGCEKKINEMRNIQEAAHHINQITSGKIMPNTPIQVRFVKEMITSEQIGNAPKQEVFKFSPKIEGKTIWSDLQTLKFIPKEPLKMRKKYQGELAFDVIMDNIFMEKSFHFEFEIFGRELIFFDADFIYTDAGNKNLRYEGEIKFNIPTDLATVKKALSCKIGNKVIHLEIEGASKQFLFKSQIVERADVGKEIMLKIEKKNLKLLENFERKFSLSSLHEMKLINVYRKFDNQFPTIVLDFSDELDSKQDITGLISVQPYLKIDTKKSGKKIIVAGDFKLGESYSIIVNAGISNKFGIKTASEFKKKFHFSDQKPQIIFSNDGMFLPSSNENKVCFRTLNVKAVTLKIKQVYESNIGFFIQDEKLNSSKKRHNSYYSQHFQRVGVDIIEKKLIIGDKIKNKWLQHELELGDLIAPAKKGLFVIEISFTKNDVLYSGLREVAGAYHSSDYYTNPMKSGYYYKHGKIVKPLIISDMGITYKKTKDTHIIFVNNILTAQPMQNVKVRLKNFQNQVIVESTTNEAGRVSFAKNSARVFFVEAEFNGYKGLLTLDEMEWNLSTFDVGGVQPESDGTRVFIYTERGVYRPGDAVNISIIARNADDTFPDNHPIEIKIFNPKNQLVFEQVLKTAEDGFYNLKYQTDPEDLTGKWNIQIKAGNSTFYHKLKIETVVPERLKIDFKMEKENITVKDKVIDVALSSVYLFGNQAAGLKATLNTKLIHKNKKFSKYKTYFFGNEAVIFKTLNQKIFDGFLNDDGMLQTEWNMPDLINVPSAITAKIKAEVFEKGGRSSKKNQFLHIDPYEYYVGIESLSNKWHKRGTPFSANVILVDKNGQPKVGEELQICIYKNNRYWWWEYDSRDYARLHFKTDSETELIFEEKIYSALVPRYFEFTPETRGEYLVEITHKSAKKGHSTAVFNYVSYWGGNEGGIRNAGLLTVKADKPKYTVGETAIITFPASEESEILITLEKADKILQDYWCEPKGKQTTIKIPITKEMMPNIYCSVSVIQPHKQTENDCPIRMFGVVPIMVEDSLTHQKLNIKMPNELKPNQKFSCEIQTEDRQQTQFTIAIVDEGLLGLTNFKTPNAWLKFYEKLRLEVSTFDNYGQIIGVNKGDIFKTFSVGGDYGIYGDDQLSSIKAKRFKAVSMFKGPFQTDESGYAKIDFELPEYVGAVRVMVLSAKKEKYGMAEKTVPIKSELMVLPTVPRVVAPLDEFLLPVTIFATNEKIKNVSVNIEVDGPLQIVGEHDKAAFFSKIGEKDVAFNLKVKNEVGFGSIKIKAISENFEVFYKIEITSRPNSPRLSNFTEKECRAGEDVVFEIPNDGIKGTNEATITIARMPKVNLSHRLNWLMQYPYGCLEQTTSAVFPQLYLKSFLKNTQTTNEEIDKNINRGIQRLRKFQQPNGGFSYWPGGLGVSKWNTNYTGHFLVEAQRLGYFVPSELLANWVKFQQSMAITNSQMENLKTRVYRLYVLALSGNAEIGAMNLLKENELAQMSDVERWLLAASYKLAGISQTAEKITQTTGLKVRDFSEFGGTYGSTLRDKAMILDALIIMEEQNKSEKMYREIVRKISTKDWYSTHTTGYALLALGKYINRNFTQFNEDAKLKGKISLPNGEKINFDSDEFLVSKNIPNSFGKTVKIQLDSNSKLEKVFATMNWSGIPLNPKNEIKQKGVFVDVAWYSEDKKVINPTELKQGTIFYGFFKVENKDRHAIDEIALNQILPSGWEIENMRLVDEEQMKFKDEILKQEDFVDIRDDRIMWFFDMHGNSTNYFLVKLNAVTIGEFTLPSTLCEAMYNREVSANLPSVKVRVVK